jgi:uncharacterized membrane protein YobD (UPF0266 family)
MKTKYLFLSIFALGFLASCKENAPKQTKQKPIDAGLTSATSWFQAWELVAKETYHVNAATPVKLVLFDEKYVYTTSDVTGAGGEIVEGPTLFDKSFVWLKKAHNGQLLMPDSTKSEVKLMSYTKPLFLNEDTTAFFVTPLPSYWKLKDIGDHGIGYDSLALIVFLHEFTHAQQIIKSHDGMDNIINDYLEKNPKDAPLFSDDMMQDFYEKDANYSKIFQKEVDLFYAACAEKDEIKQKNLARQAILLLEQRQKGILAKDKKDLAEIDNYWLTLEGLGQYSTYAWLTNPKGGNMSHEKALPILKTRFWSQEEGFPICYLLAKYGGTETWWKSFFCRNPVSSISLLKVALAKN